MEPIGQDAYRSNFPKGDGRMNIAITSLYLPSNSKIGVGYQVHGLANSLVGRGHSVTVYSPGGRPTDAMYQVVVVTPGSRLRTFGFAWDLRKVDWTGFDILNAHGDDWFLWGCDRPRHIHTYHGSCLAEMLHSPTFIGRARMAALAVCEYGSLLIADETVAVSENTRRYLPGIRHVIPCGVDNSVFRPGTEKSAAPSLLFVGTMHGRKRGRMLLDLFRRMLRPTIKTLEMWCVCEAPDGESDGEGVRFLGRVDQNKLADLYRLAWVFCLPSTYEGFGVPYIEALASGTAVVASPNPGAIEVLGDGKWGVVAGDGFLADQLLEAIRNSTRRRSMESEGLERAKDFSWATICSRYEKLYSGQVSESIARSVG